MSSNANKRVMCQSEFFGLFLEVLIHFFWKLGFWNFVGMSLRLGHLVFILPRNQWTFYLWKLQRFFSSRKQSSLWLICLSSNHFYCLFPEHALNGCWESLHPRDLTNRTSCVSTILQHAWTRHMLPTYLVLSMTFITSAAILLARPHRVAWPRCKGDRDMRFLPGQSLPRNNFINWKGMLELWWTATFSHPTKRGLRERWAKTSQMCPEMRMYRKGNTQEGLASLLG